MNIFYKDFFESIPSSNEALELTEEIKNGLDSLNKKLKNYKTNANFPFISNYEEEFKVISNLSETNKNEIINKLSTSDNLIDIKKNIIDPLSKFIEGNQGKIYKDSFVFYKENKDNFILLKKDKLEKFLEIINDPKCFIGNKIPILKKIKNELEEEIKLKKTEEIKRVVGEFDNLKNEISSIPQFINSDNDKQEKIIKTIDTKIVEINNINTINSIQAIYKYFEDEIFTSLIGELINNEKQKVISISSLKFENKKIILESEEDLIEHINNYKKTILKEIRLGNKVKI